MPAPNTDQPGHVLACACVCLRVLALRGCNCCHVLACVCLRVLACACSAVLQLLYAGRNARHMPHSSVPHRLTLRRAILGFRQRCIGGVTKNDRCDWAIAILLRALKTRPAMRTQGPRHSGTACSQSQARVLAECEMLASDQLCLFRRGKQHKAAAARRRRRARGGTSTAVC